MVLFNLPPFRSGQLLDVVRQLNVARVAIENVGRRLHAVGFLDGALVEDVSFTASETTDIHHGLGRVPKGWKVLRARSAAARLYESATAEPTSTTLSLTSETTCTADVWVY